MGVGGLAHLTRGWLILFGWSLRSPHLSPTLPLFLYTVFLFYFIVFILQQHSAPSKKPAHSSPSLPLSRRNGNAAVIVVIASRLFTNEILNGRTVFGCPTQFGRLQNNASFFQAAVTVWLKKKKQNSRINYAFDTGRKRTQSIIGDRYNFEYLSRAVRCGDVLLLWSTGSRRPEMAASCEFSK